MKRRLSDLTNWVGPPLAGATVVLRGASCSISVVVLFVWLELPYAMLRLRLKFSGCTGLYLS